MIRLAKVAVLLFLAISLGLLAHSIWLLLTAEHLCHFCG